MAFTSIAALVGGAEVTGSLIIGAIAEAGTVMSVVGGVTGNKGLSQIGGVMALAGGAGSLLSGAAGGASAATSDAWGSGAGLGQDTLSNVGADAAGASSATADAWGSGAGLGQDTLSASGLNADTSGASSMPAAGLQTDLQREAGIIGSNGSPMASLQSATSGGAPSMPVTAQAPATPPAATTVTNPADATQSTPAGTTPPATTGGKQDSNSVLSGIASFIKDPANRNMLGQLGSGALSGAGKMYEADRNYQINRDLLTLKQTQQGWGNSAPSYNGIISKARA